MVRLGRFHIEWRFFGDLIKPFQHPLDLLGLGKILHRGAAGGNDKEDAPHGGPELEHEVGEVLEFVDVAPVNRGIDLNGNVRLVGFLHRL